MSEETVSDKAPEAAEVDAGPTIDITDEKLKDLTGLKNSINDFLVNFDESKIDEMDLEKF